MALKDEFAPNEILDEYYRLEFEFIIDIFFMKTDLYKHSNLNSSYYNLLILVYFNAPRRVVAILQHDPLICFRYSNPASISRAVHE